MALFARRRGALEWDGERIFAWFLVNPWTHEVLVSMWMARERWLGDLVSST